MKKLTTAVAVLLLSAISVAQAPATTYKMTLGEEVKLRKGTADLDIVSADNTGLYFTEQRKGTAMLSVGNANSVQTLYKLDKNFAEVFEKEYRKELKGLDFQSFQELDNNLYLFATDYEKKGKLFKIYGAKIDKSSGELVGDFIELGSYPLESKKDDYEMKITPVHNSTAFLMVSNVSGKERVTLGVHLLDKTMKRKESAMIELPFNPENYTVQDVQYTKNNKVIVLGKEYEEVQYGKKKKKRLVFKQYVMSIYTNGGKKETDVKINSDDKYVIGGRLIEQPNGEMLLAGFYSNAAKKEDLNGFFINKVDPEKGTLLLNSFKEINSSMLGKSFVDETDDDDQSREEKKQAKKTKDDDEEEEFPNSFTIKSVAINPADNSIIITSEVSKYYFASYYRSSYNSSTRMTTGTWTYLHRFVNQEILVINADQLGKIKWLSVLPKSQLESIQTSSSSGTGLSFSYDRGNYFAAMGGMPFYSSFTSLINNNNLVIIMNDHSSNNVNPQYGDKVKTVYNFRKGSSIYGISIDLETGKMTRKNIGSNNDETILMPRHAFVVKNELFIPSWRQHMMAKTELRFAKIVVK